MEFKGTKVKWEIIDCHDDTGTYDIKAGHNSIFTAWRFNKSKQVIDELEQKANAQLIAHAPELLKKLAECKAMFAKGKRLTTTDMAMMADEINDLLTRATTI